MKKTSIVLLTLVLVVAGVLYFRSGMGRGSLLPDFTDGTYVGESPKDGRDQYGKVDLVIRDGRIIEVEYEEYDSEGEIKGKEYPYPLFFKATETYKRDLLAYQDPFKVDLVSGATTTWEKFRAASKEALREAKKRR